MSIKKYVLVTGGAGYIGSTVVTRLIKKKLNVIIIDDLSNGKKFLLNKKAKFFKIDIKNYKKLKQKLLNYNITSIFHFAAKTDVKESLSKPKKYYSNNFNGTQNIIKIAIAKNVKKIIFSSTAAVYGNANRVCISEKENTNPISPYGLTKLNSEKIIIKSAKKNYKFAILRYFNVVGSDLKNSTGQIKGRNLFKQLAKRVFQKKYNISVFGNNYSTKDGTCIRDYIDVNDLSDIHILSHKRLDDKKSFIINCGYNLGYSVLDVIKAFSKTANKKIKINFRPRRPGDIHAIYCNNKKLKNLFPSWKRRFNLSKSVMNSIKWEKKLQNYLK